jgi:hypothetical protein
MGNYAIDDHPQHTSTTKLNLTKESEDGVLIYWVTMGYLTWDWIMLGMVS